MINPLRRGGGRPIIITLLHPLLLYSLPGSASTRLHLVPACLNADKPQILQPINRIPDSLIQGRVARTVPTGVRSDAGEGSPAFPSTTGVPRQESRSLPDPEELSLLLSTHLRIQDNHECDSQIVRPIPNKVLRTSTPSFSSPLFLQRPRLHKRVTVPALPVGGSSEAKPGPTMNHNAKPLPPPTRGLPCISSGNRRETRGLSFKPWPPVVKTETVPNE